MIPVGQSPSLVNPFILDSLDWAARLSAPTLPTSTGLRFWVQNTQGISRLHYSDNTPGDDIVVNRDLLLIACNVTGAPLTDGQAVYVSGATGSVPQVSLAQSIAGKLPAIGIVMGTIAVNGFGYVHMFGVHSSTNTNAFNVGDNLYVSAVTPGALTNVEPTAPFQFIGVVLVKGVGNGVIYLRPTGPTFAHTILDADEHSDTLAHVPVAGDVIYANATPKWTALAKGSDGQVLTLASGLPSWATPAASTTQWSVLTNGDSDAPELIFASGDVIMTSV